MGYLQLKSIKLSNCRFKYQDGFRHQCIQVFKLLNLSTKLDPPGAYKHTVKTARILEVCVYIYKD